MMLSVIKKTKLPFFLEILNPDGHLNCNPGSKVTVFLLNGWIFPIGGASSGRICACSLRSRLILLYTLTNNYYDLRKDLSQLKKKGLTYWKRRENNVIIGTFGLCHRPQVVSDGV